LNYLLDEEKVKEIYNDKVKESKKIAQKLKDQYLKLTKITQ